MGLGTQEHDMLEVGVVDVGINTEKPLEDNLDDVHEVFGERDTKGTREDLFVIQLILHPSHQEIDILLSTDLERCLHVVSIGPEILILRSC